MSGVRHEFSFNDQRLLKTTVAKALAARIAQALT